MININDIILKIENFTGLKRFIDFDFFLDSTILEFGGKDQMRKIIFLII